MYSRSSLIQWGLSKITAEINMDKLVDTDIIKPWVQQHTRDAVLPSMAETIA